MYLRCYEEVILHDVIIAAKYCRRILCASMSARAAVALSVSVIVIFVDGVIATLRPRGYAKNKQICCRIYLSRNYVARSRNRADGTATTLGQWMTRRSASLYRRYSIFCFAIVSPPPLLSGNQFFAVIDGSRKITS